MNKQYGYTLAELVVVLISIIGLIGWIWNIVKIAQSSFDVITGLLIVRCIGVFVAPAGAVLGFL